MWNLIGNGFRKKGGNIQFARFLEGCFKRKLQFSLTPLETMVEWIPRFPLGCYIFFFILISGDLRVNSKDSRTKVITLL